MHTPKKSAPTARSRQGLCALLALLFAASPLTAGVGNPDAFASSRRVFDYLIAQRDAGKIISGQQNKILWGARTDEDTQHVQDITLPPVYPALIGLDIGFEGVLIKANAIPMATARQDIINTAIDYWKMGSLVTFSWHQTSPKDSTPDTGTSATLSAFGTSVSSWSSMTNAEFHDVVTPGTLLHTRWQNHVDLIAPYLKQLRDAGVPILWRPYQEMNGTWFWWNSRDPADYRQLWVNLYDRLVHHHGINNLIWAWAVDKTTTNVAPYYPGAAYVDIAGVDIYVSSQDDSRFTDYPATLATAAPGKPYALIECGLLPSIASLAATDYLWFLCWHDKYIDRNWATPGFPADPSSPFANTVDTVRTLYNHPGTITLDEVNFPRSHEAELLPRRAVGGSVLSPFAWPGATNGNVSVFEADAIGDYIEFDVYVHGNGTWHILADISRMNNRPVVRLSSGGANLGPPVDLHTSATTPAFHPATLGTLTVTDGPGIKTLRLTITGQNAASTGLRFAIDNWTLTTVPVPVYRDDYEAGHANDWTSSSAGSWSVVTDGSLCLQQSSLVADTTALGFLPWTDHTLSAKVKVTANGSGSTGAGLIFRAQDANNYYYLQLRQPDAELRLYRVAAGVVTQLGASVPLPATLGTFYDLKINASANVFKCYVNGVLKLTASDSLFPSGKVGLRTYRSSARFDDILVTAP